MSPRVLVIDDEPDWREQFRDIFVSIGFEADTAADRESAKELLKAGGYDLLVLDIFLDPAQVPIDYQLFLGFLRRTYPDVKVVAATGMPLAPDEAFELHELGVRRFIYKPQIQVSRVRDLALGLVAAAPDPPPAERRLDRLERAMTDGFATLDGQGRAVLRLLAADVADCPRLFTLREAAPGRRVRQALRTKYAITLWCEFPEAEHSWEPATYTFHETREWLRKLAPYALRVSQLLRVVVPMAAEVTGIALPTGDLERVQHQLDLLKTIAAQLPTGLNTESNADRVRAEEGAGLRALRALLLAQDEARGFGDLRKIVTGDGDILWVCPKHEQDRG